MPCPLFVPDGDFYEGHCAGAAEVIIPQTTLESCCHPGYARGRCDRAAATEADSVRLLAKSTLQIAWAIERDHHPVAVGLADAALPATGNDVLDAQIRAYALITARRPRP